MLMFKKNAKGCAIDPEAMAGPKMAYFLFVNFDCTKKADVTTKFGACRIKLKAHT